MKAESSHAEPAAHNAHQQAYYAARRPGTMLPVPTAYARRHFAEAAQACALRAGDRVLELGAGMGRFTALYAEAGHAVTALELSPDLAAVGREALAAQPMRAAAEFRVGDALAPATDLHGGFEVVAGYFFLHHLPDLAAVMRAVRACLKPGGRYVFVEPNPLNPLYCLQITFTPSMSWKSERGIFAMRPARLAEAARAAGLVPDAVASTYGAVPGGIYNALARSGRERWPEVITPRALRPFVVFSGRLP
jgi:SAM-dependent methyltransferase